MCMLSMLIWAMGLPAATLLLATVPPLPLTAARMLMAAACLLPLWGLVEGFGALRTAPWRKGVFIGGGTLGLGAFLLVLGQGMTDAVTVAVISASMPVVGIAIEVLLDGRKLSRNLVVGVLLSLLGGWLALDDGPDGMSLGMGAALAGASAPQWQALGWTELGALAIFAIGGLAISQFLWIRSVGHLGIALSSLHINATPFYVMLIMFALGGHWSWSQAAAAALVGLGVLVAQGLVPWAAALRD